MKTRNVTVRSVFPLTIQKKRSRARQTIGLHRDFSIAVRDLTGDEAPVAMHRVIEPRVWKNPSVTIRAVNGMPFGLIGGRHLDDHHLHNLRIGDPSGLSLLGNIADPERTPKDTYETMPFDIDKVFYDGEDDHLRRIEKGFEALAFIDGKLHKTTPLPSYMVTVGNKTEVSLDNEAGRHMNWRTAYRGLNFNADQFDTAVKLAAEIASVTPGDKRPGEEATGDLEILDFSLIEPARLPELLINARAAVNLALDAAKTSLTLLPPAAFVKLGELAACKTEITAPERTRALAGVERARSLIHELQEAEFGVSRHHSSTRAHLRRWTAVSLLSIDACEPPAMVPEEIESDPDYDRAVEELAMLR